jgi:tetratricopeptide (TPR) repeat protein
MVALEYEKRMQVYEKELRPPSWVSRVAWAVNLAAALITLCIGTPLGVWGITIAIDSAKRMKAIEDAVVEEPRDLSEVELANIPFAQNADRNQFVTSFGLAVAAQKDHNYSKADSLYNNLYAQGPKNWVVYYNWGCALYDWGKFGKAIEKYSRALELDPANTSILNNLGLAYAALSRFEEADTALQKAQEIDPNDKDITRNLKLVRRLQQSDN